MQGVYRKDGTRRLNVLYLHRCQEQRARELIDQLATADQTLEKYKSICEGCDTTDNNAQILITLVLKKVVLQVVIYMLSEVEYKNRTKCQNCGNFHRKDACRAKDKKCNIFYKIGHFSKVY